MNKRKWFPWGALLVLIVAGALAYFFDQNFDRSLAIRSLAVGAVIAIVVETLPSIIGFTHRKMGFTVFVWGVLAIAAILLLALSGWIDAGSHYVDRLISQSRYVTIQEAKHAPIVYELESDGTFGYVDAGGKLIPVGNFDGSNLIVNQHSYPLIAVQIIGQLPIVGVSGSPVMLVSFVK